MFKRKILLPQTPNQFDDLINKLSKKYKLTDKHHAAAVVSVAIRHLPHTQSHTTLEYFASYIQKAIANHVADHKNQMLKHEAHIDQLATLLRQDPNDNQARDGLEKAINEGSDYAKKVMTELIPKEESDLKLVGQLPN